MRVTVKVSGSCGEFVQGFYRGEPILITCPVEIFTAVTVSDEFGGFEGFGVKSLSMYAKTLKYLGVSEFGYGMRLTSGLSRGKGMASSSADLAAVAKAVAISVGSDLSADEIAHLAASIEPTDGIFFDGIVAMNPITGRFVKNIRVPENYVIAIFDYGGEVNTVELNCRSDFQITELDDELNFDLVEESARANQQILYKRGLDDITKFAKVLGAVTVNVAHSGTVIGIFFHETDSDVDAKIREIARRFGFVKFMTKTHLTGGGIYAEISTRRDDLRREGSGR